MGFWTRLKGWLTPHALRPRFRFPALAEANKALLAVEEEIVDFNQVAPTMERYKQALAIPEKDRDTAYIPIYLALEQFVATHQPPIVREVLTKQQIRQKVSQILNLDQMNESFRLIFLPDNEQTDHLLKIGALDLLKFLLQGLGRPQLEALLKETIGPTPLAMIVINDDGISFADVHARMKLLPKDQVVAAYQQLYQVLFAEVKNLFGDKIAVEQATIADRTIALLYNDEFLSLYLSALPEEARQAVPVVH
jgi:hypothetical protein